MLDINLLRTNPDLVRENIRKKFQDQKLPLVDEVIELDKANRAAMQQADSLRNQRKVISKQIGGMMAKGQKDEAEAAKAQVNAIAEQLAELEKKEEGYAAEIRKRMLVIPQIIDESVPIGRDDSENVQNELFGEPVVPDFEIPYHVDIMESLNGIDLDSARKTSGNGFYYLKGDIARLHSAILSYARDFMIDRGFTYYVPPFMIRSDVVTGV
ncbi:MAG: serine--tRNA ligase, partial [Clostridia bacterium]|nr:serine--tRNA ligase [Clostridia bacterium]